MKIVFRLVLLAALAAGGFWLWTVLFPSPEKVVRRQIARLAATATFKAGDNNLTRAAKAVMTTGRSFAFGKTSGWSSATLARTRCTRRAICLAQAFAADALTFDRLRRVSSSQ